MEDLARVAAVLVAVTIVFLSFMWLITAGMRDMNNATECVEAQKYVRECTLVRYRTYSECLMNAYNMKLCDSPDIR